MWVRAATVGTGGPLHLQLPVDVGQRGVAGLGDLRLLGGDALAPWAPFDLLVLDAGGKLPAGRLDPAELLKLGGALVIDDFTPMTGWPPRFGGGVDAERMHWFEHPRLLTTEIRLTPTAASLVAVRR